MDTSVSYRKYECLLVTLVFVKEQGKRSKGNVRESSKHITALTLYYCESRTLVVTFVMEYLCFEPVE